MGACASKAALVLLIRDSPGSQRYQAQGHFGGRADIQTSLMIFIDTVVIRNEQLVLVY